MRRKTVRDAVANRLRGKGLAVPRSLPAWEGMLRLFEDHEGLPRSSPPSHLAAKDKLLRLMTNKGWWSPK